MRRPAFWLVLAVFSIASAVVAVRYFPRAFSIVALDITMDREQALAQARDVMARESLGPAGYRQAASFTLDGEAQTFIELEGGRQGRVHGDAEERPLLRLQLAGPAVQGRRANETTIRFTPEGRLYGFVEKLKEDAPGRGARRRRRARARRERGTAVERRPLEVHARRSRARNAAPAGASITPSPTSAGDASPGAGGYRLRLVVSGNRLTEVTHFVRIPEAFTRRYASMRSANDAIGMGSAVGMMLLYVVGGIGVGLFFMLRERWLLWRQAAAWGIAVGVMQALAMINQLPLEWMAYDTALPRSTFLAQQAAFVVASLIGFSAFFALSFMAAETLTRRAFGHHPQLWRAWSPCVRRRRRRAWRVGPDPRADGRRLPARPRLLRVRRDAVSTSPRSTSAGGRPPRRCCIPTCSPPTRRGSRRSPTPSRPASGRKRCSAPCRSPARR